MTADVHGQWWTWRVHRPDWTALEPGCVVPLAGELCSGGYVVLLTTPFLLLPATAVQPGSPAGL